MDSLTRHLRCAQRGYEVPPSIRELFQTTKYIKFASLMPKVTLETAKGRRYSQWASFQCEGSQMLTLIADPDHVFAFIEYFALWEKEVQIMASVNERRRWLEAKQTTIREVRYHLRVYYATDQTYYSQHATLCADWLRRLTAHIIDTNLKFIQSQKNL